MNSPIDWVEERLGRSPVRALRERSYPDRVVLSKKLNMNDSFIYWTELGCQARISDRLLEAIRPVELTKKQIQDAYREFQVSERQVWGILFEIETLTRRSLVETNNTSPVGMIQSFLGLSRADLSKGLCVQPSLLYRCEKGQARSLPERVRLALRQAGMDPELIRFLDREQQKVA